MKFMTNLLSFTAIVFSILLAATVAADESESNKTGKLYELRFYTTHPGKLPNLHARFRDHTMKLFEKHGMENIIYWTVSKGAKIEGEDAENMLVYVIAHKDEQAKKASWKAFVNDPEWKEVAKESEKDGKILAKPPRSILMTETEFSAGDAKPNDSTDPTRTWELRQYNVGEKLLASTVDRFGWGEKGIFTKHGMETVKFWTANDKSAFIYLLAHKDKAAREASWKGFMGDFRPFLKKYNDAHPDNPKGRGNGMEIRYLVPTDYSPRK